MLSDDLTRTQSELYGAIRAESLVSPLTRLWALVVHRGGEGPVERNRADAVSVLEPLPEPKQRGVAA